nr:MAG TPA: hypothetical protein [Caudoviricetes sp.]
MCLQWFTSFTTSATIRLDHFVLKSHDIIFLEFYWVHSIPMDCACAKASLDPVYLIPINPITSDHRPLRWGNTPPWAHSIPTWPWEIALAPKRLLDFILSH